METKKIIEILQGVTDAKQLLEASKSIPEVGYSFDDKIAYVRRDLRKDISDALKKENISVRLIASAVGINYSNLVQYLKGTRPIPDKYLERIMGILKI